LRKAASSKAPFFMGVIKAGKEPLNCTTSLIGKKLETIRWLKS
jgi:hypothetical protein